MTATEPREDPPATTGSKKFLDYWLYGVLKASAALGTEGVLLRKVEEAAVTRFLEDAHVDLGRARTPEEIIRNYSRAAHERHLADQGAIAMRADGDRLRFEIGQACPYRTVCGWAHAEGRLQRCFRTLAFAEVLTQRTGRVWDGTLEEFGMPCRSTVSPTRLEVG